MDTHKLLNLLEIDCLTTYFQPIFSIGSKRVIGVEALLRGVKNGELVSPLTLFKKAERKGLKIELDRISRYLAFMTFKEIFNSNLDLYLFFNFDASIIDECESITWYIYRLVKHWELNPSKIVIEVTETKVKKFEALKNFVNTYRELGFLIALDDVGIDYSNLNRIVELKPDFIKIDRILIDGLAKDKYKCKLIKALADLSKQIGSFSLAEGIETEEDLLKTLELGIDFHQGFFLEIPTPPEKLDLNKYTNKLANINQKFMCYFKEKTFYKKRIFSIYQKISNTFCEILQHTKEIKNFEEVISNLINSYDFIQSAYVIDVFNKLQTPIIFNKNFRSIPFQKFFPVVFSKDSYLPLYSYTTYLLTGNYSKFISEPYIHLLTKKEVCTVSQIFRHKLTNNFYILCIDFLIPEKFLKFFT